MAHIFDFGELLGALLGLAPRGLAVPESSSRLVLARGRFNASQDGECGLDRPMWYFAYASNMNRRQIEARVQRTQLRWMVARLDGYAVQFNKRSTVDQSGKANIVPDGSGVVWGVLFELSEEEFQRLAHFEGGYSRKTIEVACVEPTARFRAETFVAKPDGLGLLPASQYLRGILDGAREHELPADYQAQLAGTRTSG